MAATYDSTLATRIDEVRFWTRDTDVANAEFQDEEIAQALANDISDFGHSARCSVYFVSAYLIRQTLASHGFAGGGVNVKQVDDLRIEFGGRQTTFEQLLSIAEEMEKRARDCQRRASAKGNPFFRVTGRTRADED